MYKSIMKPPLIFILVPEIVLLLLHKPKIGYARYVEQQGLDPFSSMNEYCGYGQYNQNQNRVGMGRVSGGDETKFGEFPWITSIQSSKGQHFCAGFMVTRRFVISAAHCFCKKYNVNINYKDDNSIILDSLKVEVNRVKLSGGEEPSKPMEVKNIILHPEFDENGLKNDIAILELQSDVEWNNGLSPICLPQVHNEDDGTGNVTVAGWGYRQCGSYTPSNELHKITVPLWKTDACKKSYQGADYNFQRKDYVCAGSDGKDILKGDSGGPLMFLDSERRWTAIGIVSAGKFMCSDRVPGVYTKVSSYLDWIKSKTA